MRVYTLLAQGIPADFKRDHRASWFAYSGPHGELLPLKSGQRLYGIGYEVKCACGWETRTGGAVKASVKDDHARHIVDEYHDVTAMREAGIKTIGVIEHADSTTTVVWSDVN